MTAKIREKYGERFYVKKTRCGECHKDYMKKIYVCKMPDCKEECQPNTYPRFWCTQHQPVD